MASNFCQNYVIMHSGLLYADAVNNKILYYCFNKFIVFGKLWIIVIVIARQSANQLVIYIIFWSRTVILMDET